MKKQFKVLFALLCVSVVGVGALSYKMYEAKRTVDDSSALLLNNAEALSNEGEYIDDCVREQRKCTITVGAKGSIKLLGGTVLTAGADGSIEFDGQVVCSSGGNTYCRPVECIDLYEEVF